MTIKDKIAQSIDRSGVAILPPMDAFGSIRLLTDEGIHTQCTMLDPWYNKGVGGTLPAEEYDAFIKRLLDSSAIICDTIYLWGFPVIIGPYVRFTPAEFKTTTWLTWYYRNCPSVIRGWRPAQNACIQFTREGQKLYPENFLPDDQKEKLKANKMRFVPGPMSVIEAPLLLGFVGQKERTDHPSQKPEKVYQPLIQMATQEGGIVFDPMAGSGTTGAVAQKTGLKEPYQWYPTKKDILALTNKDGNIELLKKGVYSLPDNLTIKGDLVALSSQLKQIPESMTVGGSLYKSISLTRYFIPVVRRASKCAVTYSITRYSLKSCMTCFPAIFLVSLYISMQ